MEKALISGIAFDRNEVCINVCGVPNTPGMAYQILGPIADANVEVDMIVQTLGREGLIDFSFTVPRGDLAKTQHLLGGGQSDISYQSVEVDEHVAKISIVGVGMRSHSGVAAKMFQLLAAEGINIKLISTSEIKISVLVDEKYLELAVRVLHKGFDLA